MKSPNRVKAHQPLRRTVWAVETLFYGTWWVPTSVYPTRRAARDEIASYGREPNDRTKFRAVKYAPDVSQ